MTGINTVSRIFVHRRRISQKEFDAMPPIAAVQYCCRWLTQKYWAEAEAHPEGDVALPRRIYEDEYQPFPKHRGRRVPDVTWQQDQDCIAAARALRTRNRQLLDHDQYADGLPVHISIAKLGSSYAWVAVASPEFLGNAATVVGKAATKAEANHAAQEAAERIIRNTPVAIEKHDDDEGIGADNEDGSFNIYEDNTIRQVLSYIAEESAGFCRKTLADMKRNRAPVDQRRVGKKP